MQAGAAGPAVASVGGQPVLLFGRVIDTS